MNGTEERLANGADEFAKKYLSETLPLFQEYAGREFKSAMDAMVQAYHRGSTVYICGNGGSAGTAGHMVNDLAKGSVVENKKRLRVIGLADNMSLLTAYANDNGYESIFVEQLKSLWAPGDVLIAISCSGANGGQVIGLVGFSGGKLKELSNHPIYFKSYNYGSVEDAQLMFSHLSSQYLHQYIKENGPAFKA